MQRIDQISIEKYLNKIAPIEIDVFADGDDNVLDADYVQPLKKAKVVSGMKPSKGKKLIARHRQLTPKERIERLKRKSNLLANKNGNARKVRVDVSPVQLQPQQTPNYSSYFSDSIVDENVQGNRHEKVQENRHGNEPNSSSSGSLESVEICDKEIQGPFTARICSTEQQSAHADLQVILKIFNVKFDNLHAEVFFMRKQLARMEAKSKLNRMGQDSHGFQGNDETFLDFEKSLAKEGLPNRCIEDVDAFELKLNDQAYRQKMVYKIYLYIKFDVFQCVDIIDTLSIDLCFQISLLSVINGSDGSHSGSEVILSIVNAVIHPETQSNYTWTGKTNIANMKKKRFDRLTQIHGLIFAVCRLADNGYTQTEFMENLVYKVCKTAHKRGRKASESSIASASIDNTQNQREEADVSSASQFLNHYSYHDAYAYHTHSSNYNPYQYNNYNLNCKNDNLRRVV